MQEQHFFNLRVRKQVMDRDNNRCQKCGAKEGLCVHHILPVAQYPQYIHEKSNCITVCRACHNKIHKTG